MEWYLKVIKQYAVFSGRARRKEYWMFAFFNVIFAVVAIVIDNALGTTVGDLHYGMVYCVYILAVLLPALAVTVRRLHDAGKSGWFYFISLIPLIGPIWMLVLLCKDSVPGENSYGPNPKEAAT
jgi:uncharacterized membrane protein YhaH (DUF805 family)